MKAKVTCITKVLLIIIGCAVLTSYSGQWEVFTGKNDVRDIALSGTTLWAATTGGVVKWNLSDNSYTSYTTADGLLSCNINQVAIDKKGRPWVATKDPNGLFVYENHSWKQMNVGGTDDELADKFISGLEVDRLGNVWVYTREEEKYFIFYHDEVELWRYNGQVWHKHKGVYGPLALDPHKNLLAVDSLFYNKNTRSLQFRISSFNGSEFVGKFSYKTHNQFYFPFLAHIAQDSRDNLWISYFDERYLNTFGVICNNTQYNTLDGLADDNVRSITADESGTVWCATDGGISKFLGTGFVTYDTTKGLASNLTYKILIGSNNTLYAATSKGISILKSNEWKTLKTINEPLHNDYTDMVVDKRDAVILSGYNHITIYNDLQWEMEYFRNIRIGNPYYGYNNSKSFINSKDGTLYAIGNEFGQGCILKQGTGGSTFLKAFSYTTKKQKRFITPAAASSSNDGQTRTTHLQFQKFKSPAVASSSNDSIFWLTGEYDDLILFNKHTSAVFPPSRLGVASNSRIICMLLDRDGRSVWIGYQSEKEGSPVIIHFDGDTVKKRIYESDGLASKRINAIARDSSENLWFASWDGISVLRNTRLTTYFKDSVGKVFGECHALFVDRTGMVWTHTKNGIARFNGSSWKLFDSAAISPDLPYTRYSGSHIIQDKSGTIWFGTSWSGLLAYKDNRWYQLTTRDGIPSNRILSCALDSKNNLWIHTDHGIAMRKSDETFHNRVQSDFVNTGNKYKIKQCGSRFYVASKDKPKMIRYTLFDLSGRVVLRQTIHGRKSFVIPENHFGSGLRILSVTTEDIDGSQNKYFLKKGDIK